MFGIFKKTLEKPHKISKSFYLKHKQSSQRSIRGDSITADMDYDLVEMILSPLSQEISKNELEVALLRLFRGRAIMIKCKLNLLMKNLV